MTSDAEICNVGLTRIQRERITSLTQGTAAANDCNAIFVPTREELLRSHDWNFARGRKKLAQLSATPVDEFDFAYQLPTDWLATRRVYDNDGGYGSAIYRMQGLTILSSSPDIYLTYTKNLIDPASMPADFRSLFSYRIAAQLALTSTLMEKMEALAIKYERRARSTDSIEDDSIPRPRGSWVTGRFGSQNRVWP